MCDATVSLDDFLHFDLCGKYVLSFLTAKDALSYATTSKTNKAASCLGILDPISLPPEQTSPGSMKDSTVHWDMRSNYHHGDRPVLYREIHIPMVNRTHSVQLSCTWKDQGWGYRKGRLYVLCAENCLEGTPKVFCAKDIVCHTTNDAEHDWRPLRLEFQPEEGKRYFIWFKVGGGGGHELFVKDLKQQDLIYDNFGGYLVRQHRSLLSKGALDENPLVSLLLKSIAKYAQQSFAEDGTSMDESIFGTLESLGLSPSNKDAMDALLLLASSMHSAMSKKPHQGSFDNHEYAGSDDSDY
uniref:Uncharacterized protein n=1 Tax=Helicotheca tamesis TaxID=374047 RepID=A0A7S2MNQ0_9STRA|mmetsp:Transcript_18929/g.26052  ORF Transcript_18929/g.26052 Transcript_18929/m.26052 type:complete len:298 (+) Transcript_18929:70-963(+)|eukprot:CAMPEP_0185728764 /NCGR_PEP_ID=MMETSP1171-20130828/4147_1 /TAXON_ID=374046 /ORGANISM="Helicotheca tamensis, Strain CCMP826" /LENGTH=297 /DNA_ID=CAMNT_0028397507 /DNA_START=33 /DNA_END=926 /DNA_ORIENTATION=+